MWAYPESGTKPNIRDTKGNEIDGPYPQIAYILVVTIHIKQNEKIMSPSLLKPSWDLL